MCKVFGKVFFLLGNYKNVSRGTIMILRHDIPNFTWQEVLAGFEPNERFWSHMVALQKLREYWEAPLRITSGFRSEKHNEAIGGAKKSQHMIFATDIIPSVKSKLLDKPSLPIALNMIADKAEILGFTGIGRYDVFVHLDMRDKATRWDNRTK